jgi:hypothetical protein
VPKTPAAAASNDASSPTGAERAAGGKGRPTPSRDQQVAARKRPLVADTKEAKARARAELAARREKARVGMANGDERYLPVRDKGPQRRFVRDFVDAGWRLGEALMPAMVVVIVLSFIPLPAVTYWSFIALWIFIMFVVGDMIITAIRVKKAIRARYGADRMEKGLGWYAAMRSMQMRFMRLPKPQVSRGAKLD